jgi:hypothetical protein
MRSVCIAMSLLLILPTTLFAKPMKACLKESTGKVVIKRKCNEAKGQKELDSSLLSGLAVSQVGPQGPVGPQGATGPQGPAGADGADGLQGPVGAE